MIAFNDPQVNRADELLSLGIKMGTGGLYASQRELDGRTVTINNREVINFTSCSYLGLDHHPKIKEAMIDSITKYGASFSTSRIFCSSPQFQEMENLLGEIFEAPLVVSTTTTLGHFSTFPIMIQENDTLILDQQVHKSVQLAAGLMVSKASIVAVKHNDMQSLEEEIQKQTQQTKGNIWYCADGVYSMFGDYAPLANLYELLNRYENLYMYIDDAHGMSWCGENGKGLVLGSAFVHPKMIVAVSLGKAFGLGGGGAVVFQQKEWQRKVDTCGPMRIFGGPLPIPLVGGAIASAKIHLSKEIDELQKKIQERIQYFVGYAKEKELPLIQGGRTPIQYVLLENQQPESIFHVVTALLKEGFYVNPATFPAVPKNRSGCRLTLSNHLTFEDIRGLVDCLSYYSQKYANE